MMSISTLETASCDSNTSAVESSNGSNLVALNPAMIAMLCKKWQRLSEAEKTHVRSVRSRAGVTCDSCGLIGYFHQICPACTQTKQNLSVSLKIPEINVASTSVSVPPGKGFFWGDTYEVRAINAVDVRLDAETTKLVIQADDNALPTYKFFHDAKKAYSSNLAETTLLQVLRKLIRQAQVELLANAEKLDSGVSNHVLVLPEREFDFDGMKQSLLEFEEYRNYFYKKDELKSKLELFQQTYMGSGGKGASSGGARGSRQGISSGFSSSLATADTAMSASKLTEVRVCRVEGEVSWQRRQEESMRQRNDQFEHIIQVIRDELLAEHKREACLLGCPLSERRLEETRVWKERFESADRIVQTLGIYRVTSAAEHADYFISSIKNWRKAHSSHSRHKVARVIEEGSTVASTCSSLAEYSDSSMSLDGGASVASSVDGASAASSSSNVYAMPELVSVRENEADFFRNVGLESHIRDFTLKPGHWNLPTLIDVPTSFRSKELETLTSQAANEVCMRLRRQVGAKPKVKAEAMTPLYYRFTQFEKNSMADNDSSTYNQLGQDRRISSTFSRPMLSFVPVRKENRLGVPISTLKKSRATGGGSIADVSQLTENVSKSVSKVSSRNSRRKNRVLPTLDLSSSRVRAR